ncbi:MAG: AAA family ATPase, partial [Lachnospiraceae bacterium]|nr:AAA family ATPase [Lachnospiraceae bacterium]
MYREIAKLIMYGDMDKGCILYQLGEIFRRFDEKTDSKPALIQEIYTQLKRLLIIATDYGFNHNLWHNYLTFFMVTNENPFSITCEKVGANDGSVNHFAKNDFRVFKNLFDFDFSQIEGALGIDCFSHLSNYRAIGKKELMYNKNVSEKILTLSAQLEQAADEQEFFDCVTTFYKDFGVGMFGLNKAFRIQDKSGGKVEFLTIN